MGGAATTLDGMRTSSLFTPIVPTLELKCCCCCSACVAAGCGSGVAKGLEFCCIARFGFWRMCLPALLSAQSGVCEMPGVPCA